MPRGRMEGNRFFSLDVDFFSDKKVKILKARYGADGITLYIYLLCEIYKNGYYLKIDDDFEFIVSTDLNMNIDKVKQVLTFLLERSMLDKQLFQSDAVLTSAGIQRRFQRMVKTRAVKNPISVGRFWILSEEETEPFIKVNPSLNNSGKNEDISEKNEDNSGKNAMKRKENKIIDITAPPEPFPDTPFQNKELEDAFQLFLLVRSHNGTDLMPEQVKLLREELAGLGNDDKERIAIAKKAAASNWKSFYPTRTRKSKEGKGTARTKSSFNNFEQREYDYKDLEKKMMLAEPIEKQE